MPTCSNLYYKTTTHSLNSAVDSTSNTTTSNKNNNANTTSINAAAAFHTDIFTSCFSPSNTQQPLQHQQKINSRRKFKQLSLYEKMYTIVKTLYQSLDMKLTCKKILNTVSLLLDADRCSLFLVSDDSNGEKVRSDDELAHVERKKCLISVIFDAQSTSSPAADSDSDKEVCYERIKIPYGVGIAGCVAATGKPLNIPDAYKDTRFNATIDSQTGYKTKSILCMPILNEHGQCIAVAEALNKLGDNLSEASDEVTSSVSADKNGDSGVCFTSEDEEVSPFTHAYVLRRKREVFQVKIYAIWMDPCVKFSKISKFYSRILNSK